RLSGAVRTDNAVNVPTGELNVYIFVKYSLSELDGKIRNCDHPYFTLFYLFWVQRYENSAEYASLLAKKL
ncbi:MAG: hypothetical protein J6I61_03490, partial [Prevotella sp.]|nr:hypothetical protein [Prevotella sp.]